MICFFGSERRSSTDHLWYLPKSKTFNIQLYFFMALSQWLLIGNWLVAPAYIITYTMLYLIRIDREEMIMLEYFGEKYLDYMKRTGRLFPLWSFYD